MIEAVGRDCHDVLTGQCSSDPDCLPAPMPEVSRPVQASIQPGQPAADIQYPPIQSADEERPDRTFLIFNTIPSWLASFLVNLSLVLLLALFAVTTEQNRTISLEAAETDIAAVNESEFSLDHLELDAADPLESQLSAPPSQEFSAESEPMAIETDVLSDSSNLLAADSTSFDGQQFNELSQSATANEFGGAVRSPATSCYANSVAMRPARPPSGWLSSGSPTTNGQMAAGIWTTRSDPRSTIVPALRPIRAKKPKPVWELPPWPCFPFWATGKLIVMASIRKLSLMA